MTVCILALLLPLITISPFFTQLFGVFLVALVIVILFLFFIICKF